jgi:hypothetical protein
MNRFCLISSIWKKDIDCLLSLNAIDDVFFGGNTVLLADMFVTMDYLCLSTHVASFHVFCEVF